MARKKNHTQKKEFEVKSASPNAFLQGISKVVNVASENSFWTFSILSLLILTYVFHDFLFFKSVYLFKDIGSDSVNVFFPQYIHLADYYHANGLPRWSFNEGMGQNIFGFSFGNPFHLLYVLAGKENIPYAIIYVEGLKIFLAGTFFFLFLKSLNFSAVAVISGALMYEFCGFLIIGSGWYQFSNEGAYFALLLLSLELFISRKKIAPLVICVALTGANQPFNLYLAALLSIGYLTFRELSRGDFSFKKIIPKSILMTFLFLLGVGISSVFLFSNVEQILQSPRGTGDASYFHIFSSKPLFDFAEPLQYISLFMRSFSGDLLGNGSNFKGWTNYLESPMSYCGLACFLLAPQYFFFQKNKQRNVLIALLAICIIPLVFPYFRYAFWLFSGDYYRLFSLFISIVFLLFSLGAMNKILRGSAPNMKVLAGSLFAILLILYFPNHEKDKIINHGLRWNITLIMLCYSAIIWLFASKKHIAFAKILFLFLCIFELSYLSSLTVNERKVISASDLKQKTGYNDYSLEALNFLRSSDSSFYRILKDYTSGPAIHGSLNDAKVQGFFGTASYNSFPQKYYIRFFQKSGISEEGNELQTRWVQGLLSRTLLHSVTSCKYILSKSKESYQRGMGYDSVASFGDVHLWKNKFFAPLGFTYSSFIPHEQYIALPNATKDKVLLKSFVAEPGDNTEGLAQYSLSDTSANLSFLYFKSLVDSLKEDTLQIKSFSQNKISGKISLQKKKMLFFSIPFDKGWKCLVNGENKPLQLCNLGFSGTILDKGNYEIELSYEPPSMKSGTYASALSLLLFGGILFFRKRITLF